MNECYECDEHFTPVTDNGNVICIANFFNEFGMATTANEITECLQYSVFADECALCNSLFFGGDCDPITIMDCDASDGIVDECTTCSGGKIWNATH